MCVVRGRQAVALQGTTSGPQYLQYTHGLCVCVAAVLLLLLQVGYYYLHAFWSAMARYFEERAAPAVWLGNCYRNHMGTQASGWVPKQARMLAVTGLHAPPEAPLEGPREKRGPEINRQAQYLRAFDIYCSSEQTTTRTAVVHVQVQTY